MDDEELKDLLQSAWPPAPGRLARRTMRRVAGMPRDRRADGRVLATRDGGAIMQLSAPAAGFIAITLVAGFALGLVSHGWLYPGGHAGAAYTNTGLYMMERVAREHPE